MKPVILTLLPNNLQFIGTFDVSSFKEWWLSSPLPGNINSIISNCWVGGSIHAAVCLMNDGSYSIYQSINYGKDWAEVYNTINKIYQIEQIDFGRILVSTSAGWLESTDSATTFHQISTQAPGCKTVINIGEDGLMFAHDGNKVWRSNNLGRDWAAVLDCHRIAWKDFHNTAINTTSWSGDVYPALAGVYNRVLAGCGPYLLISEDQGNSWTIPWWYIGDPSTLFPEILPFNQHRIMQILHSDVLGTGPEDNVFLIKVYHIHDGIVRHYYARQVFTGMTARFDQFYSEAVKSQLTAYKVLRVGTDFNDQIVFSGQTRYDTQLNQNVPSLKYSPDGGWTWIDIPLSTVTVYPADPSQEPSTEGGAFIQEYGIFSAWSGQPCHNSGRYITTTENWVRNLSYDVDCVLKIPARSKEFNPDIIICKRIPRIYDMDLIEKKAFDLNYITNAYMRKTFDLTHYCHAFIQKTFELAYDADAVLVDRHDKLYQANAFLQKRNECDYTSNVLNKKDIVSLYGMNIILRKSHHDEIARDLEINTPQFWDITAPLLCRRRIGDLGESGETT